MAALLGIAGRLTGGIGLYVMLGAALLAWTVYTRHDAATKAKAECRAEQIQAALNEVLRQQDIAEAALKLAQERADAAQIELQELERENTQIKSELGAAAADVCRVPRDATRRLRNIR